MRNLPLAALAVALFCGAAYAQTISGGVAPPPCTAFGTANGTCIQGAGALGTPSSGNGSNLTSLNATNITSGTLPAAQIPVAVNALDSTGIRVNACVAQGSGVGVEECYTGGAGYVQTYNRTTPGYSVMNVAGSTVNIQPGGSTVAAITSGGMSLTGALTLSQAGTFTCNSTSTVTVTDTNVTAITNVLVFSLNTPGGTVGLYPSVKTITANTGFTLQCTAADTSIYNYRIIK